MCFYQTSCIYHGFLESCTACKYDSGWEKRRWEKQDERPDQCILLMRRKNIFWRCFEVDQVRGASAGILLPGNWASTWLAICIIEAHCCFLNCFPVSLALGFIRTSTHSGGHQSLFDLSSWIGLHTVALAQQPHVFVLDLESQKPPMSSPVLKKYNVVNYMGVLWLENQV